MDEQKGAANRVTMARKVKKRKRKDHWLPQGYLRGFIGPSRAVREKPLCCFLKAKQQWCDVSTLEIGYGEGFYDYAKGTEGATHTDVAFAHLEREFPQLRDKMIANGFAKWEDHKPFLLHYMQMLRARSPLALRQWEADARKMRGVVVTEVHPDGHTLSVDSLEPRPLPEQFIRNYQITKMLEDIRTRSSWMTDLHWCLRYTSDENDPYCSTDQAIVLSGTFPAPAVTTDALHHPNSLLIFPLCWQACLIGSVNKFNKSLDRAHPEHLRSVRRDQMKHSAIFVVSPVPF